MYITSEVLYAENPPGTGEKSLNREGEKSVTIAGRKNPPVRLSAFSPWPSTGDLFNPPTIIPEYLGCRRPVKECYDGEIGK